MSRPTVGSFAKSQHKRIACTLSIIGRRRGLFVERRTPERVVGPVRSSLRSPCCVLEQDTFTSPKVLVIPRKRWLRPDMTEKLLAGTLNLNKTKTIYNKAIMQ